MHAIVIVQHRTLHRIYVPLMYCLPKDKTYPVHASHHEESRFGVLGGADPSRSLNTPLLLVQDGDGILLNNNLLTAMANS